MRPFYLQRSNLNTLGLERYNFIPFLNDANEMHFCCIQGKVGELFSLTIFYLNFCFENGSFYNSSIDKCKLKVTFNLF